MTAPAVANAYARPNIARQTIPASVEALTAIIDYYGFDHFFDNTLRMIDLNNPTHAQQVDEAIDRQTELDQDSFTVPKAFNYALREIMREEGVSKEEALEMLADNTYKAPMDMVQYYSIHACDTDAEERLSALFRNRARRMLKARH